MIDPKEIEKTLKEAEIENAQLEANWIAEHGKFSDQKELDELLLRRSIGEPLQYLLGEWEFYGYPFKLGKGVFIPRPETELLVESAIENLKGSLTPDTLVLDLCAGSGCIGITIAKEVGCKVIAVEKSELAIKYLKENAALNNVQDKIEIIQGDVLSPDLVKSLSTVNSQLSTVINPPYLSIKDMLTLQKEVTHEPTVALFGGGVDGLDFYRDFFRVWADVLKSVHSLICEVGEGQAEAVSGLFTEAGLTPQIKQDYNKIDRVVYYKGENNNG